MRLFRKKDEGEVVISGMRPRTLSSADADQTDWQGADIDFPTVLDDIGMFLEEDVEFAQAILEASPERLMGSAALYLASADMHQNGVDASIAMAFMMMAQMRTASMGTPRPPAGDIQI